MNIRVCLLLNLIAGFFILSSSQFCFGGWEVASYGIKETYANLVFVDSKRDIVYVATDNFVYASKDNGETWKEVFSAPGKEAKVTSVAVSPQSGSAVIVATEDGFYLSEDSGHNWHKYYQKKVNYVTWFSQDNIYMGTDEGVFVSHDSAVTWQPVSVGLGILSVKYIETCAQVTVYACTSDRIFKSEDSAVSWKEVYSFLKKDAPEEALYEEFPEDDDESFSQINSLVVDADDPAKVYAATSKGVLFSGDAGRSWSFMTKSGIDSSSVKNLIIADEVLYAATSKGVFQYSKNELMWVHAYAGAGVRNANFLSFNKRDLLLWVAAENGVFVNKKSRADYSNVEMDLPQYIKEKLGKEPTIAELQRAAINYAEVHPDKIKNWRKEAKIKALIPEFDLGYDKNVSLSATNNNFIVGPNGWNMDLKWNVGDVIFSDDQTNIDVRSRLMVQLRDDILDDVTRLYYERRRLQVEMFTSPPKSEKDRYEKLLRLEELAANIDALTGGYFSAHISKV